MQDLNDMLYFAEVVDMGGFAAAGRALGIPKSRLSRRVAELESRLGVRLMQRTTRKLSLTEAGERYHRHCAAMRDEAGAAAEAVAQVQAEPRGTIRVACPVTLAQTTLGPVLPVFLARYPHVRVDMRVSNRTVDDLERLDTVAMLAIDGRATWQLVGPGGAVHALINQPRDVADDLLTLKMAVVRGTGISVLPDYMCRDEVTDRRLVEVLPGWAPQPGVLHAVFSSHRGMTPAVRRFLDFLGVYWLPILTAQAAPEQAQLDAAAAVASCRADLRRDLPGSDALHWGEGTVTLSATQVAHSGRLAPGPAYRLYLTPRFVDTGDAFLQVRAQSVAVGDIKSFDGFILPVPAGVDTARYSSLVIWCEAFQRFITSASYR